MLGAEPVKVLMLGAEPVEALGEESVGAEPVEVLVLGVEPVEALMLGAEPAEALVLEVEPVEALGEESVGLEPVEVLVLGVEPAEALGHPPPVRRRLAAASKLQAETSNSSALDSTGERLSRSFTIRMFHNHLNDRGPGPRPRSWNHPE